MEFSSLLLLNASVITAMMFCVWLASLPLKNAGIVDAFWGFGFVLVAAANYLAADGWQPRMVIVTLVVFLWGLRLSLHLAQRNFGADEDYRYQAMRRRWGPNFPATSLLVVFGLQALLMWLIAVPISLAQASPLPDTLVWSDYLGLLVCAVGFGFEAVADAQLSAFRASPQSKGKVLDSGLWKWSRHPNYFGDATLWWGLWLFAWSTPASSWTVLCPVLMNWLLLRVSGVPLTEKRLGKTREDYADYVARTSRFIPWPPKTAGL